MKRIYQNLINLKIINLKYEIMTIDEFDKTGFTGGMRCLYNGKEYPIFSVDFEERLIAINETNKEVTDDMPLDWKRCENIIIL